MRKLLTIIKREYVQGARSKGFIISTILGPVLMVVMMVLPGVLFGMKTGEATRGAVVDQTGEMYERVRDILTRSGDVGDDKEQQSGMARGASQMQARYKVERAASEGKSFDEVKRGLSDRVRKNDLDAYLILPPSILTDGKAEYYGRNLGDVISVGRLQERLSRAVVEQRMLAADMDVKRVDELFRNVRMSTVKISERGEEENSGGGSFFLAFGVAAFIVIALLMYGQVILSAVVEEKTTRLSEVLFSSVQPFQLMAGKLIGVSLVALTQYAIWAVVAVVLALYGAGALAMTGANFTLPQIAPSVVVYALLFFLLGFFIYATVFMVIGAVVTSEKESSQIAIYLSLVLIIPIYLTFPIIRSPNSALSFWVSMFPFFSPITMLVRIMTETPPFWQIALSILIGIGTIILLVWLAARIYRMGMLMYGKRPNIPEILRWVRQG